MSEKISLDSSVILPNFFIVIKILIKHSIYV